MNKSMYLSCVQTAREVCTYELSRYRRNSRDREARNYFQSGEFERWFTCSPKTVRVIAAKLALGAIYDYVLSLPVRPASELPHHVLKTLITTLPPIRCRRCGFLIENPSSGHQKYCSTCSEILNHERQQHRKNGGRDESGRVD